MAKLPNTPTEDGRPANPSRRGFFKVGAGAVVAGSMPGTVASAAAGAAEVPVTIAGRLAQLNTVHHGLRATGLSKKALEIFFDEERDSLRERIEKQTGLSYSSINAYLRLVSGLEDKLTKSLPNKGAAGMSTIGQGSSNSWELARTAADIMAVETLSKQNPQLVAAARLAISMCQEEQREFESAGLDHIEAIDTARKLIGLTYDIPASLRPEGNVQSVIAESWKHFDESYTWFRNGITVDDKESLIRDREPMMLSRETILQQALIEIIPHVHHSSVYKNFRIGCPSEAYASLTMTPVPPAKDAYKLLEDEQDKSFVPVRERLTQRVLTQRRLEAEQYIIEHPIDLSKLKGRETADLTMHLNVHLREEDCIEGQDASAIALIRSYPKYFIGAKGEIPVEQRAHLVSGLVKGAQLFSNASTLAQVIARLSQYRGQMKADEDSLNEPSPFSAAARDPVDQLLLQHIRTVAPEGTVIINPDGTFVVQDETLRAEVAREEAALADPVKLKTDAADHGVPLEFDTPREAGVPLTNIGERKALGVERTAPPPPPSTGRSRKT